MPAEKELPELAPQAGDAATAGLRVRALRRLYWVLMVLLFRVRVRGQRNLPAGRFIICTNHMGWIDRFLVICFLPVEPRIYVLADETSVSRTGFRAFMMRMMAVAVTRDLERPARAVREMEDVLERGGSLLIFPEGAPSPDPRDGEVRPLSLGAGYLSALTGLPIVPAGIGGTGELWLRGTLRLRVGKPIYPAGIEGDRRARARTITQRLEHALRALAPPPDPHRPRFKPLSKRLTGLFT